MGGVFGMGGAGRGQRVDACLCTVELVYCLYESMSHLSSGTNPNKTFRAVVSYFLERSSGCFSLLWLLLKCLSVTVIDGKEAYRYIYIKLRNVHINNHIKQLIECLQ